jgi:hypothetical protein
LTHLDGFSGSHSIDDLIHDKESDPKAENHMQAIALYNRLAAYQQRENDQVR